MTELEKAREKAQRIRAATQCLTSNADHAVVAQYLRELEAVEREQSAENIQRISNVIVLRSPAPR